VRLETRPPRLPAEDRQLVPEHEDLELLRTIAPGEQYQKRKQTTDDEVERRHKQRRPPKTEDPTLPPSESRASTTAAEFPHPTRNHGEVLGPEPVEPETDALDELEHD
jgi:hypothetical protein